MRDGFDSTSLYMMLVNFVAVRPTVLSTLHFSSRSKRRLFGPKRRHICVFVYCDLRQVGSVSIDNEQLQVAIHHCIEHDLHPVGRPTVFGKFHPPWLLFVFCYQGVYRKPKAASTANDRNASPAMANGQKKSSSSA